MFRMVPYSQVKLWIAKYVHAIGKAIRLLFADPVTYIIMTGKPMHTMKEKTPHPLVLSIII